MKYTIATKNGKSRYVQAKDIPLLEEGMKIETREVSADEYEVLGIPTFVYIKIPVQVLMNSPELKQKLLDISIMFSTIKRYTYIDEGYTELTNIVLTDIPKLLTKAEYENLKSAGVEFSEEVDALFSKNTEDETTPTE